MARAENVSIFNDTYERFNGVSALHESTVVSEKTQEYYIGEGAVPLPPEPDTPKNGTVVVTGSSTFDAARKYTGKVAVLNFASATRPGGGVTTGSTAQEECLCRCSNLYHCISSERAREMFYKPHAKIDSLHNDDIIYTSGVLIIKSDDYADLAEPFPVDVITCAAPNLRIRNVEECNVESKVVSDISDNDLLRLHIRRAGQILRVAALHDVENLVLGAFGCGAFRNKPEIVAEAYLKVLPRFRHYFNTIEFAVYCAHDTLNYDVFKKVLAQLDNEVK